MASSSSHFRALEKKWQKAWADAQAFQARDGGDPAKKYYVLEMFPYPSASFLHVGHMRNYTIGDAVARYKRMKGFNVMYPMGFDAFGLPAENAAIKEKIHPKKYTERAIKTIKQYMGELGLSYDWTRELATCYPEYYKWNQWLFLRMLEKGIAYRKEAPVNWCPHCTTVLANEEVINGHCWRCDSEVMIKPLAQWFLKITAYAEELLKGLDEIQWPERVKELQRNWIGRSEGTKVAFSVKGSDKMLEVFTTRADTLFGASFVVCAVQHPFVGELVKGTRHEKTYHTFLSKVSASTKLDVDKEKEGFFTGRYVVHPLTGEELPLYAGTFVVADYGTGVVMGVPAHDQRDFDFAKKHKIAIKQVVAPFFVTAEGKDAVRKDKPTVNRDNVFAIVKHWKEDKYFCLDWKQFGWKSFVIGGVDKGERPEEAARREVIEETGYTDIKSVTPIGFESHDHYYAEHKGVNRYAASKAFLVTLKSGKHVEPAAEHVQNHIGVWLAGKDVASFLNLANNHYAWDMYRNGERAFVGEGVLINSDAFSGLDSASARLRIGEMLAKKGVGGPSVEYKLRDWLISRQRYWGTPIPIVYCKTCGVVPIPEKDLPVVLPEKVTFSGKGNPLTTNARFVKTPCPVCGESGRRETDTMATFFDSSWYFLRYCSPHSHDIFDRKAVGYWMPANQYIGGIEHAVLHLLYARFFTKFLRDIGWLTFDEPFTRLFNQGLVLAKGGEKMSKSKGNVVTTRDACSRYGTDATRLFLLFVAGPDKPMEWDDHGIEGAARFVQRFQGLFNAIGGSSNALMEHKLAKTLMAVEQSFEQFAFNKGLIALMDFVTYLSEQKSVPRFVLESLVLALSPIIPHVAEELWHQLGHTTLVVHQTWPKVDESKLDNALEVEEQQLVKLVEDIRTVMNLVVERGGNANAVYVYVLPQERARFDASFLSTRVGKPVRVFAVNDPAKHDPSNKSSKVKPGRPGIYVE